LSAQCSSRRCAACPRRVLPAHVNAPRSLHVLPSLLKDRGVNVTVGCVVESLLSMWLGSDLSKNSHACSRTPECKPRSLGYDTSTLNCGHQPTLRFLHDRITLLHSWASMYHIERGCQISIRAWLAAQFTEYAYIPSSYSRLPGVVHPTLTLAISKSACKTACLLVDRSSKPLQCPVRFCRQYQIAIVKQVSGTAHTQYTQNLSDTDHAAFAPSFPGVKLKKLMLNIACSLLA
jgi:hypothetical protein